MTQQIVNNIAAGFVIIPTTSTKNFLNLLIMSIYISCYSRYYSLTNKYEIIYSKEGGPHRTIKFFK